MSAGESPGQLPVSGPPRSRALPVRRGLWYRVHPAGALDLDPAKARSRPVWLPGAGQSGLSAFASPHLLYGYIRALDWGGRDWLHGYDDGDTPRRVIAFHGREAGRGAEDEPLVEPAPDMACCGRILHAHLAWSTFIRNLSGTPRPRVPWSPVRATEMSRLRASGQRGRHRRLPDRASPRYTYHRTPYAGGVHWFSAETAAGEEAGYAHVLEMAGPGGPHVEISTLWTGPFHRRQGIGSQLIEEVAGYFPDREIRLKPYPIDEDGTQTTEDLEEFYAGRGFDRYRLRDGDPWSLGEYMTRPPAAGFPGVSGAGPANGLELAGGVPAPAPPVMLPPRQRAAFDAPFFETHRRRMLEVAVDPEPGTRVWRGEQRPCDEDLTLVSSVGMHWGVNPDTIARPVGRPGTRTVIWQATIEQPAAQVFPRGHPIWSGKHRSLDSEAEVRIRPGTEVWLEGAWVAEGRAIDRGYFLPAAPERMGAGWRWCPAARHVTVEHKPPPDGVVDYSDVGGPVAQSGQRPAGQELPAPGDAAWGTVSGLAFPAPPQARPPGDPRPPAAAGPPAPARSPRRL